LKTKPEEEDEADQVEETEEPVALPTEEEAIEEEDREELEEELPEAEAVASEGATDEAEEGEVSAADAAVEPYAKASGAVATVPPTAPPEYRDITELLNLPQIEAARRLNIPMSTLSKRWKEAVRVRKWPHRQVAKLDKEIMTLLHNIPARSEGDQSTTPPEIEQALGVLLRRRQEELRPVKIRM
jgi:hypothetical protein